MNYKQAIEKIKSDRKNKILLHEQLYLNALMDNPDLRQLEKEIFLCKNEDEIDYDKLSILTDKKEKILDRLDLAPLPQPSCPICNDTGIKDSKPCSCVIKLVSDSELFSFTFSQCNFEIFDESRRQKIIDIYQKMQGFCQNFPTKNKLNILLYGGTGTGKTFLASCIADAISKRGFSVIFTSAFGFSNKMLNYHTALVSEKSQYISPFLDCDLLIVDDLGSENIIKNVTVEYFYNVLNERIRLKRHTLITTNLDDKLIFDRYGQRTASRLFDKNFSMGFTLSNTDLRKKV